MSTIDVDEILAAADADDFMQQSYQRQTASSCPSSERPQHTVTAPYQTQGDQQAHYPNVDASTSTWESAQYVNEESANQNSYHPTASTIRSKYGAPTQQGHPSADCERYTWKRIRRAWLNVHRQMYELSDGETLDRKEALAVFEVNWARYGAHGMVQEVYRARDKRDEMKDEIEDEENEMRQEARRLQIQLQRQAASQAMGEIGRMGGFS